MTRDEFIVDVWERMGTEVVGASELETIGRAFAEHFGSEASPASIARVLADHGAHLSHPHVLQSDLRWREEHQFFTPDELALDTPDAAVALMEKLEHLRHEFRADGSKLETLRSSVRQIKNELELLSKTGKLTKKSCALASETVQWLTVWLQNPQIFSEWLNLRRNTAEFEQLFGTFSHS